MGNRWLSELPIRTKFLWACLLLLGLFVGVLVFLWFNFLVIIYLLGWAVVGYWELRQMNDKEKVVRKKRIRDASGETCAE